MKYKVMIVEDQTMPRELFELRIQSSEHFETALSIDNASLAEVYCLRFPVDLILMDVVTRNGENGLDAAAKEGFEVTGCLAREVVIGGIGRNGFGQGVFAAFFKSGS